MKKLINDPRTLVREMLEGAVSLVPHQALLRHENVVLRRLLPAPAERQVAIISGGGSGHEPAHAGYVGEGMLSAAVVGDVFTSPSADAVLAAIRAVAGPAGALLVVKNYTGDRLNFGLAAELARQEGIPVEIVVVADDVSLRDVVAKERRRGIAGTVFVHKLAGAAAREGRSLADVAEIARKAAADLGSMGVGLGSCTVPAAGKPGFSLGENEIELGLGIHGEKGVERTAIQSANTIVDILLDKITADLDVKEGERVALLVNGLGATPPMELAIVARHALANLRAREVTVARAWSGNYMTALEMPGCSLSLLRLSGDREALLAAPTNAPAWAADGLIADDVAIIDGEMPLAESLIEPDGPLSDRMRTAIFCIASALEAAEDELTDLDSRAGDGDLGSSMARGAAAMRALPQSDFATPTRLLVALGNALRRAIAGSSGPFYATALLRAGAQLDDLAAPSTADWLAAFETAVASISELGGAKPGDRTMLDALQPAADAWRAFGADNGALHAASMAAIEGARRTADLAPALGRASYLGDRALGIPDGGAVAVSIWLKALAESLD
jgi:dihydroxyacetone kinase